MEIDQSEILNALPVMAWTTLLDGSVDFINRLWWEYTGFRMGQSGGWEWQAAAKPSDLPQLLEEWQVILKSGKPGEMEARLRRLDGRYRRFLVQFNPLQDKAGRLVKWLGVAIDVEDVRRAEQKLRRGELDLRFSSDSISVPTAVTTATGEVDSVNRPALEFVGKSLNNLKELKASKVAHPDDLEQSIAVQLEAHRSRSAYNMESRLRRADGVYRWNNVLGMPLPDQPSNILRWLDLLMDIDQRKRAEDALAASERNLRLTIDTIPALAWSARPDGAAEFLSKHYLDYIGVSAEKAQGWGWSSAVHPDDLAGLSAIWKSVFGSGLSGEAEARLRRFDGEYRWFLFRVSPLRDDSGNIVKWYGVNTDIEDRKHSEESFRAIVETTPESVKVIAREGTVLRVNSAGAVMAGVSSADVLVGQNFFDFVAPEHREKYRAFHDSICAGQKGFLEFDLINALGVRRHVETHAAPLRNGDRSVAQLGITRDITERKQMEEKLRRSEAFLAEGQDLARMGNLSWRVVSGDIVWSEQLYRIFEFEQGTSVTLDRIASRIHPEDESQLQDMVARAKRGESDFEYQPRIVLPDGSIKYLRLIAHRARDDEDQVEYIGAVLDITQRRRSEEAVEKLRSELAQVTRVMSLGALTASIAHEVNQPLAGILTNASTCLRMLASDPPNIEVARETARRAIRDSNRATDVIARLRALFSKREVTNEPVDLNEAAREVIALTSSDLQRNRVMLRAELADDLPPVAGDRVQLQQVIMNLLRNASDSMSVIHDRPRLLSVCTSRDADGQVRFSVRDAGIGLGTEGTERLFEAFYTTKSEGMGIGLSVSRSIVERHNGRLWAQANDGPGATFSFSIPLWLKCSHSCRAMERRATDQLSSCHQLTCDEAPGGNNRTGQRQRWPDSGSSGGQRADGSMPDNQPSGL